MSRIDDFEIEYGTEYTIEEIAKVFGVQPEQIRQIEAKALKKIRHSSRIYMLDVDDT